MKRIVSFHTTLLLFLLFPFSSGWAQLSSGTFSRGLQIAFDSTRQTVTGYFEEYSGYDDELEQPKFSCIFFIHGVLKDSLIPIKTYYPFEQTQDTIHGYIRIINDHSFEMKLEEEHGGCWNVSHFSDEAVVFNLDEKRNWLQVSYSIIPEMKIYSDSSSNKKLLLSVKNKMILFIDDKQNGWCRILIEGKKPIQGWVTSKEIFGF